MVFLVWKSAKDEYEWTIGGYNETEKYFYANLGLGGMIVDTDEVVAWAELFKDETLRRVGKTARKRGKQMIQKRSRIKINTDLAKIRQAGKNPQEVQKELFGVL